MTTGILLITISLQSGVDANNLPEPKPASIPDRASLGRNDWSVSYCSSFPRKNVTPAVVNRVNPKTGFRLALRLAGMTVGPADPIQTHAPGFKVLKGAQ